MTTPTLPGVTPTMIATERITTRVLLSGPDDGVPVLFLHGNSSSATWWEQTMLALPAGFRGIAPDQRGFGDADAGQKIDATRGAGDWADDAVALLDALGIDRAHLVGNSLGGVVVWRLLADAPQSLPDGHAGRSRLALWLRRDKGRARRALLRRFCRLRRRADRRAGGGGRHDWRSQPGEPVRLPRRAAPAGLQAALRASAREEDLLSASLSIHAGERAFPGDKTLSPNWPFVAPGVWGAANALSPKYVSEAVPRLLAAQPKPPVLWVRGSHDLSVSDQAAADLATLGALGLVPGWPGADLYPPQPMLKQTRAVLERYAAAGGWYREVVIDDAGHAPFIEKPNEFNAAFHAFLTGEPVIGNR
jgi:pimeloyl-ACP methyl ester carboxylesterase